MVLRDTHKNTIYFLLLSSMQHLQTMEEEKAKLDAFCEHSLKEVKI